MNELNPTPIQSPFFREYDLDAARKTPSSRVPEAHQVRALGALGAWFTASLPEYGGLLVIPTGGGKTFTAVRHLCTEPLSEGWKVLWLAHTHHLLEQAADAFGRVGRSDLEVGHIAEGRARLRLRVVSGAPGHSQTPQIRETDDVLVATVQAMGRAWREKHPSLISFLKSAGGKLYVVFDEAHHTPAPSYCRFLRELRKAYPGLRLLGLTATPTYGVEERAGWLWQLFPQRKLSEATVAELMAAKILARPCTEQQRTAFEPSFDESQYQRWSATYRDLPEGVVTQLANNQQRNDFIVDTYVAHRERYGRTLVFADRWFQCDYLRTRLLEKGVRADVVYSHLDSGGETVDERNRRTRDQNAKALHAFREGALDVLINVRMLTEGTDVPEVNTVFLTRQTTSSILLTQMIGRALRGLKFGGTEDAFIVSFIDDWQQSIAWAEFTEVDGGLDDETVMYGKRPALQLISIDLVRRLSREMTAASVSDLCPFIERLPVGWYRVEYQAVVEGRDEDEAVRHLVMVYSHDQRAFDGFVEFLTGIQLEHFSDPALTIASAGGELREWRRRYFSDAAERPGVDLTHQLFELARHVAQSGEVPRFFAFEERNDHDLDVVARHVVNADLGARSREQYLEQEYHRSDRFWPALLPTFPQFRRQYLLTEEAQTERERRGGVVRSAPPAVSTPQNYVPREPDEAMKRAVKRRDGERCRCCLETKSLQIDHIVSRYYSGEHAMRNLQTLCSWCNGHKRVSEVNFTINATSGSAPGTFELVWSPTTNVHEPHIWERFFRRNLNFFYRCAAVDQVSVLDPTVDPKQVNAKSWQMEPSFADEWRVRLYPGNDPDWIQSHLGELLHVANAARTGAGKTGPTRIRVVGAGDE